MFPGRDDKQNMKRKVRSLDSTITAFQFYVWDHGCDDPKDILSDVEYWLKKYKEEKEQK